MNEIDIFIERLRNYKPLLEDQYGVINLGIFGSYVKGKQDNTGCLNS